MDVTMVTDTTEDDKDQSLDYHSAEPLGVALERQLAAKRSRSNKDNADTTEKRAAGTEHGNHDNKASLEVEEVEEDEEEDSFFFSSDGEEEKKQQQQQQDDDEEEEEEEEEDVEEEEEEEEDDDEEDEEEDEDEDEDAEDESSSSETASNSTEGLSWIAWFCSLPGHDYFCEVSDEFISDDFNLTGLAALVPYYESALDNIKDIEPEDLPPTDSSTIEVSAELLYILIHQRYITTRPGMLAMLEKYEKGLFSSCPRTLCQGQLLLPVGLSDTPGVSTVKLYCPNCVDLYAPSVKYANVDGAGFGTTFPHLLLLTYPEMTESLYRHKHNSLKQYEPKIYGFKVHPSSRVGPKMAWLRSLKDDIKAVNPT